MIIEYCLLYSVIWHQTRLFLLKSTVSNFGLRSPHQNNENKRHSLMMSWSSVGLWELLSSLSNTRQCWWKAIWHNSDRKLLGRGKFYSHYVSSQPPSSLSDVSPVMCPIICLALDIYCENVTYYIFRRLLPTQWTSRWAARSAEVLPEAEVWRFLL